MIVAGLDLPEDVGIEAERLADALLSRFRETNPADRDAMLTAFSRFYSLGYADAVIAPPDVRSATLRAFGRVR